MDPTFPKKPTVMIVEDEGIVALDLSRRIMNLGYEVIGVAVTGREAIETALEERPNLILMDVRINSEMDGITAVTEIQQYVDIPIIYISANADKETIQRAKLTRPYGYLIKPFKDKELYAAIEIALYRHAVECTNAAR